MEDKELKKKLSKVPDIDEHGEPIWKIQESDRRDEERKRSKMPLFLRKTPSAGQFTGRKGRDAGIVDRRS